MQLHCREMMMSAAAMAASALRHLKSYHLLLSGVLVVLVAAVVGLAGSGTELPLDSHDAYVARTAQVMLDTDAVLVPQINGEPRLNKPPLNYWLVMLSDALGRGQVTPFEARLPSILAGMLLAAVALSMGTRCFGSVQGLAAGLLTAGCAGLSTYSHSVRPEMVYAALASLSLLLFLLAVHRYGEAAHDRARWLAYAGWLVAGLATLSKGPQLPLIMMLGLLLGLSRAHPWRQAVRMMHPGMGLVLFLLPWLWWYLYIYFGVDRAGTSWAAEVGERWEWNEALNVLQPYYLYRPLSLLLPWVALYPLMFLTPWMRRLTSAHRQQARLLWWVLIVAMLVLSLATHRRWYYMLPLLPVMATLMSVAALALLDALARRWRWSWSLAVAGHGLAFLGVALTMYFSEALPQRPPISGLAALGLGVAALLVVATWDLRRATARTGRVALVGTLLLGALLLAVLGADGSAWGKDRFQRGRFAQRVAATVGLHEPIYGVEPAWEIEQYYLDRHIPTLERFTDSTVYQPGTWLVVRAGRVPPALSELAHKVVLSQPVGDSRKDRLHLQLWRIESKRTHTDLSLPMVYPWRGHRSAIRHSSPNEPTHAEGAGLPRRHRCSADARQTLEVPAVAGASGAGDTRAACCGADGQPTGRKRGDAAACADRRDRSVRVLDGHLYVIFPIAVQNPHIRRASLGRSP